MKKQPTAKQLEARKKFGEQAKARANFIMTAKINDQIFTAKTKDLPEALESLGKNFGHVKTKMLLKISKGGKEVEKFLTVPQVKRLFRNAMARRLFAKNIAKLI